MSLIFWATFSFWFLTFRSRGMPIFFYSHIFQYPCALSTLVVFTFFRSMDKKQFRKNGFCLNWPANIGCLWIIASRYVCCLIELPICFKVVEGASIVRRYIFLKLPKVQVSLLTPRFLLLADDCSFFAVRCSICAARFLFLASWCALIEYFFG